jgi:hypothetical protein
MPSGAVLATVEPAGAGEKSGRNQIGLPSKIMIGPLHVGTTEVVGYRPKPLPIWLTGGVLIWGGVLVLVLAAFKLLWAAVVLPIDEGARILLIVVGLIVASPGCFAIGVGALMCFCQWRGLNGVTVTATGITLSSIFGTQRAEWSSLTAFVVATQPMPRGPARPCAKAGVIGPGISRNLRRRRAFVILDWFTKPIATIVGELNVLRPRSPENDAAAAIAIEIDLNAASAARRSKVLSLIVTGALIIKVLVDVRRLLWR